MLVIVRRGIIFNDETIYVTGHSYEKCKFRRCTFVVRGFPFGFVRCSFEGPSQWDFDFVLNDPRSWANLKESLFPLIEGSIVSLAMLGDAAKSLVPKVVPHKARRKKRPVRNPRRKSRGRSGRD